ncbi:MAG: hypothetical protein K2M69_00730 [Muribaculaceae bacterium]|nr:hypothetical protein [Muribaculaceae bacterium]
MSILETLDCSDWFNGKKDAWIEKYVLAKDYFLSKTVSVIVVDPSNELTLPDFEKMDSSLNLKRIDLSLVSTGEYNLFCRNMAENHYDGLLLDHIDRISDNDDREYWEEFVRFALKREDDFPLGATNSYIDFSSLHIAVHCYFYPPYLEGKSLQAVSIEI